MERLSLGEIIAAVDGKSSEKLIQEMFVGSVSIDTRKIEKDALYIPIKGEQFDGHAFIEDAFKKGARVALTENKADKSQGGPLIYVEDTKKALMDLAAYYRSQFDIPVVAVTGSVGKTSTKDLIAAVLSAKYHVHKTQGNFNNEIGLPLTIFGLNKSHDVLVVEMGMNHFGEISNLTHIARPSIGVITNIGVSHIENLGSREGILKAKCEILEGIPNEGLLIINGQDDLLMTIQAHQERISYGRDNQHLFYADQITSLGAKGSSGVFNTPNRSMELMIPGLGEHVIDNALAAIAVAEHLGLSSDEIKAGFESYKPTKMRMDLHLAPNQVYVINDTYNASPDSMKAALKVLKTIPNTKRHVAILGDMFELGDHARALHEEVGRFIGQEKVADYLITVGDLAQHIQSEAIRWGLSLENTVHFNTQEALIPKLKELIHREDLVLVKASRGMVLEKTVDEIGKVNLNES